jgi:DNA-binding transcriptional MocR family regulator
LLLFKEEQRMPEETVSAADLVRAIQTTTARGIAADVTAMVQRGELLAGTRLPTVRAVAAELAVSPATVVNAWSLLQRRRVIATFGRRGAFVSGLPAVSRPTRFDRVGNFGRRLTVDLTELAPDPALLPDLRPAFAAALDDGISTGYGDDPITPRLRDAVAANWSFAAQDWSAVNGGYEALHLLAQTTIGPGDAVAVEEPTAARLLDIIESLGGQALPVICDQAGPLPASLAAALSRAPVAFIFQPRGQSPAGHYLTPERCAQLAAVLQRSSAIVIEDDGAPELSCVPAVSIGSHLPERTVLVRSFSKSHGPDLRLAVVGGGGEIVSRLVTLRTYGARWTSRILQDAAAFLLTDETSRRVVALARDTYATRRTTLAEALADRGIRTRNRDGLALWVPVEDERHALVTCAAHGIATSPGSRFCTSEIGDHLRVSPTRLADGVDFVAEVLTMAAHADL